MGTMRDTFLETDTAGKSMPRKVKVLSFTASLIAVLALAACETTPPTLRLPDLTYAHLPPFNLAVGAVETTSRYASPMAAPNIEHLMPVAPAKALNQWSKDRLKAAGGGDTARLVILDASVTETALKRDTGFAGYFKREQSERYAAAIEAAVEIVDGAGRVRASASARVRRSTTVREDATLNDREKAKFDLVEALMRDFDAEIEKNIRQYLVNWLR